MNHHLGHLNVRRIAAMTFALIMALAMTAVIATGQADAKKAKKAKVSMKIKTSNQAALLKAKALTVKVKSTAKATVKLSAVSGGKSNSFKKKTVKFKKKGTKQVKLGLTSKGKTALATCGAKTVKVSGSYKKGKKKAKATKSKKLAKSNAQCPVTPPSPAVSVNKASDQASPTNVSAIKFTLNSNLALTAASVEVSDFTVSNATVQSVTGSGTSYTVNAIATADGNVIVAPSPSFAVTGENGATATTAGGTDRTVVFDATPPSVSLDLAAGQTPITNLEEIEFALKSNEPLDASTVTASDFGVANDNGTVEEVSGSGDLFTITVGTVAEGDVELVASDGFSVSDTLGNVQTSVSGDPTVEFDLNWRHVPVGDDPASCDFLDTTICLQPFPNDYYTVDDPNTPTGKRVNLAPDATPTNSGNANPQHLSVAEINMNDGFSPGNAIMLKVPGLDTPAAFENSGLVTLEDISAYDDPDQSVLLINADTGERMPIWAELDSNPTTVDPGPGGPGGINANPTNTGPVNLLIRPAKNLEFGERYIIAFRNLKDADDEGIPAPVGFEVYRDNRNVSQPVVEERRPHMESIIDSLVDNAGVDRSELYMAWDFTVASEENITGRATDIRDHAFAELGDTDLADRVIAGDSPDVDVLAFCDKSAPAAATCGNNYPGINTYNPNNPATSPSPGDGIQRTVVGYIRDVPCYLDEDGCPPGSEFEFNPDGSVNTDTTFTMDVPFRCVIPSSIVNTGTVIPGGTGTYGHGLLGTLNQVNATVEAANRTNSSWCAANWDGFSTLDIGTIIASLGNMSNFHKAVDRMQQGFLNFMMIQRALAHPDGFADETAFNMTHNGLTPLGVPGSAIDTSQGMNTRGYYYGISQGGIMGGALTALSPDVDRGVLGVPGINYSTLLRRSVDSDEYFKDPAIGLYRNYPDQATRPLLLSLMQMLWDRGEGNGYAHNTTDNPLPNTNSHEVLLQPAVGDHQVSNFAADVQARTYGALRYAPTVVPARKTWDITYEALPPTTSLPAGPDESFVVYYDSGPPTFTGTRGIGTGVDPLENVPPRPEWGFGRDPHGDPRQAVDANEHIETFYESGTIDECAAASGYCFANGWDGTSGLTP